MNDKLKWLRAKINTLNMQGIIISNPINIRYLTGINAEGVLLITIKENIYITDGRYIEAVNKVLTIYDDIIVYNINDVSRYDYENFFMFCENVGFEENYITYAKYKEFMRRYRINNLEETEFIIEKQRMIKDAEEIENIKHACKITDECFSHLKTFIKKGRTEKEIALEIEKYFRLNGADGLAFDTIVASGPNSSMPHAIPTDRQIQTGDVVLIDFGCKYNGYCSDMTRTVFIDAIPEEAKPIYDLVLKNQLNVIKELKDGVNARLLSKMVETDFKVNGHDLLHALGHSLGLEIHENPNLSTRCDFLLKENMIVTNEPGIYIPGRFGVRIEDTMLITKNGSIKLTNSEKNYTIING